MTAASRYVFYICLDKFYEGCELFLHSIATQIACVPTEISATAMVGGFK